MEFFINKGASLPVLKLELINDGRNDFSRFFELIQNANIFFTMTDVVTGVVKIGRRAATTIVVTPENCVGEEYYLGFYFTTRDTNTAGRYIGKFEIQFLDGTGTLIVPIRESLYINVLDGDIKK